VSPPVLLECHIDVQLDDEKGHDTGVVDWLARSLPEAARRDDVGPWV
jgi:hypothetical protein